MNSKDKSDFSHFISIAGGAAFGYWLSTKQSDAGKRSRAEIDDPEFSEEACGEAFIDTHLIYSEDSR